MTLQARDLRFMRMALTQARRAGREGEVPVGALLVTAGGERLLRGRNRMIASHDPTAHAEVVALRAAARATANYRLAGATLYVTLEPCLMCLGALVTARVGRIVYAAPDPKRGAAAAAADPRIARLFHHRVTLSRGPLAGESGELLKAFFRERRAAAPPRKGC